MAAMEFSEVVAFAISSISDFLCSYDLGCDTHIFCDVYSSYVFTATVYVNMRQQICDNVGILVILLHVQICNFVLF